MSSFPDYYSILNIPQTASTEEVRQAYRKESLRTHPDRQANASPEEKKKSTEKFQAVADAYYVLSDPQRRKEYDDLYKTRSKSEKSSSPGSSYEFFANMFGGGSGTAGAAGGAEHQPDAEHVFGDAFEDLLRPEVEHRTPWWSWVGTVCGGGLGFIVANVPGTMVGALAGNRLGAIRDAKGKSVAAVFAGLGGAEKAEILRMLALKVLGSAM
ncbi:DnaJ-domain-containing protein [Dentipellis sp. KUC8613]|nr:DnaJ-domain-containing protein [Dentipellis sp. KUC8613]